MFTIRLIIFIFLFISILSLFQIESIRLSEFKIKELKNLDYDELHEYMVRDQIENHQPALQSLKTRPNKNLDGIMNFCLDPYNVGMTKGYFKKDLRLQCEEENFYLMPVPSAFNDITSNETVKNYIGWFWYQTSFTIEVSSLIGGSSLGAQTDINVNGSHWLVQFEAVNYMALVWAQTIDPIKSRAKLVGSHVGGYLPFVANITELVWSSSMLLANKSRSRLEIRLTIAVSNKLTKDTIPSGEMIDLSEQVGRAYQKFKPDFDFFHFSGLTGSVNLVQLSPIHFSQVYQLIGLDYFAFNACISEPLKEGTSIRAQILNLNLLVGGSDNRKHIEANRVSEVIGQVSCYLIEFNDIKNLSSWLDSSQLNSGEIGTKKLANLYRIRFDIIIQNMTTRGYSLPIDTLELKVGLRSSKLIDPKLGLVLYQDDNNNNNNSSARGQHSRLVRKQLQGFGMHQEMFASGRWMSLASITKDLYLLKWLGANVIRSSHYPYSSEYLDLCDEIGILVIAESQAVGLDSFNDKKLMLHKQLLLEMMTRDQNHASIVAWSLANEPRSDKQEAKEYFEQLTSYARTKLDPFTRQSNRLITAAIAQDHSVDMIGHTLDFLMINRYYGWYSYTSVLSAIRRPLIGSLTGWSKRYPQKPILISEFGADSVAGLHSKTSYIFSEEFQRDLIQEYENVFDFIWFNQDNNDNNSSNQSDIIFWGSMIWNFADFSTHDSLLRVGGNKKGIFNQNREPKLSVQLVRSIYLNRTSLYVI